MGVSKNRGYKYPKMDGGFIMENPMNKWMIWVVSPLIFGNTHMVETGYSLICFHGRWLQVIVQSWDLRVQFRLWMESRWSMERVLVSLCFFWCLICLFLCLERVFDQQFLSWFSTCSTCFQGGVRWQKWIWKAEQMRNLRRLWQLTMDVFFWCCFDWEMDWFNPLRWKLYSIFFWRKFFVVVFQLTKFYMMETGSKHQVWSHKWVSLYCVISFWSKDSMQICSLIDSAQCVWFTGGGLLMRALQKIVGIQQTQICCSTRMCVCGSPCFLWGSS